MSREMKNSGVPWIGEIPKSWKIIRNKVVFRNSKTLVGDKWDNTQLLSLTTKGIKAVAIGSTSGKVPDSYGTYQIVEKGNIVMCLFDLDCSAVFSGLSYICGMISPAYKILTVNNGYLPEFYAKWFEYIFDGRKFMFQSKNIRYSLTYAEFASLQIVAPTLKEQQKIASFLDRKCAEIDEVIALQEKIVEELKAYKQSVISEAVTKGLNPDVPMKDSGIKWIGEIPEHWEICKIKNGLEINPDQSHVLYENTEVSYMPMECLRNGVIEKRSALYGSLTSLNEFSDGDIVMAKVTPCFENSNIAIASDLVNGVGFGSSEIFVFRCYHNTLLNYAFYYLQSPYIKARGVSSMTGTGGLKRINPHFFCDSILLLPSFSEQQKIADFLDTKCTEIDNLIAIKQSKITSLKEYKKSIIYEYVTGKKEVKE